MPKRKIDPETGEPLLTYRENRFVDSYVDNGPNGARAAVQAGYSPKYAARAAYKVLSRPAIQERIQERIKARVAESEIDPAEPVGSLVSQMRADVTDCFGTDGAFSVDLARQNGLGHLLKVSTTIHRKVQGGALVTTGDDTRIEFLSPQAAAIQLVKIRPVPDPKPAEPTQSHASWDAERVLMLEQLIASTMQRFPDLSRDEVIDIIRELKPEAARFLALHTPPPPD